jgi:hypothetical protein
MISNDYSKAGSASFPLPKDGVIVFTDSVTSDYAGGGDLYQNPLNTLRTSGAFRIGKGLTIDTVGLTVSAGGMNITGTSTVDNIVSGGTLAFSTGSGSSFTLSNGTITSGVTGFIFSDYLRVPQLYLGGSGTNYIGYSSGYFAFTDAIRILSNGIHVNENLGVSFTDNTGAVGGIIQYTDTTGNGWRFTGTEAVGSTVLAYWSANTAAAYLGRSSSSIRYKENISKVDMDINEIVKLQPSTYTMKEQYRGSDEDGNKLPPTLQLGIVAEDAEGNPAWNALIVRDEDGEVDAWAYQNMGVVLLSAVRQLHAKNKEFEARIAELES